MNLPEFIQEYRKLKLAFHQRIPADITERWISRVIANNLHLLGELGAEAYLSRFGRNIGEDKVVYLAIKAETEGHQELASGFWKAAYTISSAKNTLRSTHRSTSTTNKANDIKKRRLNVLEEQQAYHGALTPPHIVLEIEDLRRELAAYNNDEPK